MRTISIAHFVKRSMAQIIGSLQDVRKYALSVSKRRMIKGQGLKGGRMFKYISESAVFFIFALAIIKGLFNFGEKESWGI